MHSCKINQHTLPGSTIPRNMLPLLSLRVESIWFAIDLEDAWLVLRGCIPRYDLEPRSLRLVGCLSKPPYLCEYLTRVNNPMTYPADVVIASGAYMVRQRSRRRLGRSPQMHTIFWPPSISLAAFLSKPACRSGSCTPRRHPRSFRGPSSA